MSLTESCMLPLRTIAPEFHLPNTIDNKIYSLIELKGLKGSLVIFMCNHCPYVIHLIEPLIETAKKYLTKGINTISISSNSIKTHPQDGPKEMKKFALDKNFSFPYLYDETQEIAKKYNAACTPDFYLFDKDLKLVYRGRYDDSRPGNDKSITGKDLHDALDHLLINKTNNNKQYPSMGCNIKWY
tara:strand:+ start:318 stop:872 length:555 start_codon:yes stop_codon:yes gene_type:complete